MSLNDPTRSRYRHLNYKSKAAYRRFVQVDQKLEKSKPKTTFLDIPAHGTYGSLLFRKEWRARRTEILTRDKNCIICSGSTDLQVHHRQYHFIVSENNFRLPWEYPDHLLITLCESCHKRGHSKFKVPTINF